MSQIFFEGPEKKFEIILNERSYSLRNLGDRYWNQLVELAGAKVLSTLKTPLSTAYLLSESSLFVFDDRVIMITCGQTTLARSLVALLKKIPIEKIDFVFYERKNHFFPEFQPYSFDEDADYIGRYLPMAQCCFGESESTHINLLHTERRVSEGLGPDMTFELLMHGIHPHSAEMFVKGAYKTRYDFYRATGMNSILPGFQVDDYFFEPRGYSLNALKGNEYYTFHVTPEACSSYVSFETNHLFKDSHELAAVVRCVLALFQPETFDILLLGNAPHFAIPSLKTCDYKKIQEAYKSFHGGYAGEFKTYSKIGEKAHVQ
jgi:S-adenosylmethionine decarboxylase